MKLKRIYFLSLVLVFILAFSSVTYAFESNEINTLSESEIMSLKGPTVIVDLGEYGSGVLQKDKNGDYHGEIKTQSLMGVTAVSCTLSGGTYGVSNLYTIYIRWVGTNQVANIRATSLKISSTSILNPETYWNNSFFVNAGSTTTGYSTIGVVGIPTSVEIVRIKTTGLQCFFNNASTWLSTGEINGTVDL